MKPRVRYLQAPTGPDRSEESLDAIWSKAGEEEEHGIEEGQESRLMGTDFNHVFVRGINRYMTSNHNCSGAVANLRRRNRRRINRCSSLSGATCVLPTSWQSWRGPEPASGSWCPSMTRGSGAQCPQQRSRR
jgi:hypothetical protein